MSTLGQKPATQHVSTEKQTITGNGGTSYTLQQSVSQASDIEVFVNNTRQEPTVAYTANNTTLTMTGAVNASDSFYVIFQGKAIQTAGLPVDAAITASTVTTSQTITSTGNITTSGTVNTPSINGGQIGGRRNLVINGAMQVAQRGTQTGQGDSNKYSAVDRFQITSSGTNGRLTSSQSTDAPAGFSKSLQLVCTTADTSIAAGEFTRIRHRIEGQNLQHIEKGTSSAKQVTLSYHAKANAAGVIIVEFQDADNNRLASVAHSITTSYQKFTHTFPADTTGAIIDSVNTGATISWVLHAGSNYTSGTLGSTFATGVDANKAVGQTFSIFAATSRQFNLSGVQLEVGEQATPFEHLSYGETLSLAQRYYYRRTIGTSYVDFLPYAIAYGTTDVQGGTFHPVQMRASPTLAFSGILKASQGNAVYSSAGVTAFTSNSTKDSVAFYTHSSTFSGLTQFRGYQIYGATDDYMEVIAEL